MMKHNAAVIALHCAHSNILTLSMQHPLHINNESNIMRLSVHVLFGLILSIITLQSVNCTIQYIASEYIYAEISTESLWDNSNNDIYSTLSWKISNVSYTDDY